MKIKFDLKADVMYIKFKEGEYHISKEIDGGIILDYAKDGKVIGIEILQVSQRIPNDIEEITVSIPH